MRELIYEDDLKKKRRHLEVEGAANSNNILQLRGNLLVFKFCNSLYVVTGMIWKPEEKKNQQRLRKHLNMAGKYRIMSRRIEKIKGATFMEYEYYMLGN